MAQLVKNLGRNAGDLGSIPGLWRSPGEVNGYSLHYSGLENYMDCVVHGVRVGHNWVTFTFTYYSLMNTLKSKRERDEREVSLY